MLSKLRGQLTYSNVIASIAMFVALGGSSYAAITISGKHVKNSSLTGRDVKNNSLTGRDVKNLVGGDFKAGEDPGQALGAVVDPAQSGNEKLVRGRGAITAVKLLEGTFAVIFNRQVSGCTSVATLRRGGGFTGVDETSEGPGRTVIVTTFAGAGLKDQAFNVIVAC